MVCHTLYMIMHNVCNTQVKGQIQMNKHLNFVYKEGGAFQGIDYSLLIT